MTKTTYKKKIETACQEAGTYQPFFDQTIDALAGVLENRDRAQKQFKQMNYAPVISYTNKSGKTNLIKNPALVIINELNAQALQYWRELGLTARAFQGMEKNGLRKPEKNLEEILEGIL